MTLHFAHRRLILIARTAGVLLAIGCVDERKSIAPDPVYADEIAQLLEARCGSCHGASDGGTLLPLDSYLRSLGCSEPASDRDAAIQDDAGVPRLQVRDLLDVLKRKDHAGLLTAAEQRRL